MTGDATLGIDVGTTSVKAGVIGAGGRLDAAMAEAYPTARPSEGWVEQDPGDWIRLVDRALDRVAAAGLSDRVGAVGLTSQVNTHVFVDADGTPLMPAILWQDTRAAREAAELDAQVSEADKIAWWGAPMPIDSSHLLARMLWVSRHRPEIWDKTAHVMLPKDVCLRHLTGQVLTDPVSAIGLVDKTLDYIQPLFDLVPGAAERLVPLWPVTEIAGALRDGLPLAGRPMVTGTMDAWAGLVGTGGARPRASVYLGGTSEILGISSKDVFPTPGAIVFPEMNGIRMHAAPTQSGGDAKLWFAGLAGLSPQAMADLVATTPPRAATPLFLPQLEGERAPLWDADLRAGFLGMSRRTGTGDLARAVYEGVAFSARMALETLQASSGVAGGAVTCGGGGFQSDPWNQIRADVLGAPLRTLTVKNPGVLGAASLAAIGAGIMSGFDDAMEALAVPDRTYEPDPRAVAHYDNRYGIYKDALATNAALGKRLSRAVPEPSGTGDGASGP